MRLPKSSLKISRQPPSLPKSLWINLGKRFFRPLSSSFKKAFSSHSHDQEKELAFNNLVNEFSEKHRDAQQLSNDELRAIRRHFESMPLNYIRPGYSAEVVLQHIRLLQQTKDKHKPTVLVREHICRSRSDDADRNNDLSASSFSSEWTSSDDEHARTGMFEIHFSFPSGVSESTVRKAFEHAGILVISVYVFNRRGLALVVASIQCSREDISEVSIQNVVKDSNRRSKLCKLLFKISRNNAEEVAVAVEDEAGRSFNSSHGEVAPRSSVAEDWSDYFYREGISVSSGMADALEAPMGNSEVPSAGTLVRILLDDSRSIDAGKALLSKWLIDSNELEVGERIASGASGTVYRGRYRGQSVAVKQLKGFRRGSRTEGEFRREVLGLISCAHTNVLKLYGVCVDSRPGICIVTKFMEGGSLLQYLQQRQRLHTRGVLRFAKDVAQGMQFLHSRGIVHMDLKTANVFLDEEGNAVIGDLGVAHLASEKVETGEEIGTYRWMAPEVCGAESGKAGVSPKSDVYSFGILLWELVTCKIPYADYNPVQAAVGVVMHGLRPAIPSDCFPPFRYLIEKCWSQNPSDRPDFSQIVKMLQIISKQYSS